MKDLVDLMKDKNLLVLFPGKKYAVTAPLLYFAEHKFYQKGYDVIYVDYGVYSSFDDIKSNVLSQKNELDLLIYNDIVFLSKSIGTIVAGWLAETLNGNIRHICLTPLNDTLQYIKNGKNISIIIAGTNDKYMDAIVLKEHCDREKIRLELIDGANHNMEIPGETADNIDILKYIVELY